MTEKPTETEAPGQGLVTLLDELRAAAARPLEAALAMPPRAYCDEAFTALEKDRVLSPEWHCLARADELPAAGDYLTDEIAGEAVMLLRDTAGALRAFSNVCRHRLATLLTGRGNTKRIICPYHAWNYDLTGQLRSASFMPEDFDPAGVCLPALKLEIWQGWVYVNLDPDAPPLAPRLTGLERALANYRMADYRQLFRAEEVWETNWKCLIENFTEPYHLFHVHAKTVEPALPTQLTWHEEGGGPGYSLYYQKRRPGVAYEYSDTMTPVNPNLSEEEQRLYPLYCVFPTHLVALSPERIFWMTLRPLGSDRVKILWGADVFPGSFPAGEKGAARLAELRASLEAINAEDKEICAAIRRNATSRFAAPGRLAPKERGLWEFQRYLARRLALTHD